MTRRSLLAAAVALGLPVLMSHPTVAGQTADSRPATTVPYPGAEPLRSTVGTAPGA